MEEKGDASYEEEFVKCVVKCTCVKGEGGYVADCACPETEIEECKGDCKEKYCVIFIWLYFVVDFK